MRVPYLFVGGKPSPRNTCGIHLQARPVMLWSWRNPAVRTLYVQVRRPIPTPVCKQLRLRAPCGIHGRSYGYKAGRTSDMKSLLWTLSRSPHTKFPVCSVFSSAHTNSATLSRPVSGDPSAGSGNEHDFELVYKGPLRAAIRAVKIFSLTTCAAAVVGGPILVLMGNPSVPLVGRVLMTSLVMTVGISTTLILHWLMKGYVIEMYFDPKSERLRVHTLTMLAGKRCHTFHLSEAGPPESITAFSTFRAQGKSYFMHTEVMENKDLLGKILGPYSALENGELWEQDRTSNKQDKTS